MCLLLEGEWVNDEEYDIEEIGFCDTCDAPHENGSTDHCVECGNCYEHCVCYKDKMAEYRAEVWEKGAYSGRDMFDRMEQHLHHDVEIERYGTVDLTLCMAVECLDCNETIFSIDNGYIDEGPADGSDYTPLNDEEIKALAAANKEYKDWARGVSKAIGRPFRSSDYDGVNPGGISVVGYPNER